MNFRTPIRLEKLKNQISHKTPVIMLGSCFTDNVGEYLKRYLFDVTVNPFGVIYNPMSVKRGIDALLHKDKYSEKDLSFHNELWFSFDHYTKYADSDKQHALDKINSDFTAAKIKLREAGFLVITFGTAFAYRYRETGEIVCNCHKIPASQFDRFMLSPRTIIQEYQKLIGELLEINPALQIIFTVSPVRHMKDGMVENQRSKAALLLSIKELSDLFPDAAQYFPSYEIMMDDLRDYRFYNADLIHPNDQAIKYIWEKFLESAIDHEAQKILKEIDPLLKSMAHKPLHKDTDAYQKFSVQMMEKERELKNKYPFLKWENIRRIRQPGSQGTQMIP